MRGVAQPYIEYVHRGVTVLRCYALNFNRNSVKNL